MGSSVDSGDISGSWHGKPALIMQHVVLTCGSWELWMPCSSCVGRHFSQPSFACSLPSSQWSVTELCSLLRLPGIRRCAADPEKSDSRGTAELPASAWPRSTSPRINQVLGWGSPLAVVYIMLSVAILPLLCCVYSRRTHFADLYG